MADFNPDEYLKAQSFNPDKYLSVNNTAVSANNPDVPTDENIIAEQARVDAIPVRTFGEKLEGAGETALTLGTGATTGALGFGAGTLSGIIGELTGRLKPGEGLEEAQALAAKFTNLPESEAGKEYVTDIGETLGTLPPVGLTGGVMPKIKLPNSINKTLASIIESSPDGVQKSFAKKLGEDRFEPHIFGMVKEARKQGFDDSVTTLIANSSPITKRRMLQQIGVVERGKGNARIKALERTADIAGDSLVKKIDFVKSNNKNAGVQLGRVAETLKKEKANISEPVNKFLADLDEMGVRVSDEGASFVDSQIEFSGPAKTLITNTLTKLKRRPEPSAFEAHKFKKFLDEDLKHGKKLEGGVSGKVESVLGDLRRGVNESIGEVSPKYKQANKQFSETITALNELQDVAGRKLDFSGPNADKAAGVLLRSQTNNTKGRANLLTAISNLEDTAKKYGGSFDDDILNLSIFSDELDAVFGSGARTSLRGEVGKAGVDTAIDISQMTIPGALAVGAKAGAKRIRGINEANQLKAIKKLLKAK